MNWRVYTNTIQLSGCKEEKVVKTCVSELPEVNAQFIVFERYSSKGNFKDYVAYCKTDNTRKQSWDLAIRIKGSFNDSQEAMNRCNAMAEKLLNVEDYGRYIAGTEYIDDGCPTRDRDFD